MAGPLPLFLLRTVLFPHMPLSLHVFEERYQQMMADCLEAGSSFGVVAIREGREVVGEGRPHRVGTLARIAHVERLDDGRMNLLVTGASRFRITRQVEGKPYAQAEIEYLPEGDAEVSPAQRRVLLRAFDRYLHSLSRVAEGDESPPELPDEDEALAYLVAATLETSLDARQQLLEADSPAERMQMELKILRREEDLLRRQVLPATVVPGSFSEN
ncbi:MAG: LON peptidase substrate-binding domain-containing protein [Candidatus Dormiibacterota bacterium]